MSAENESFESLIDRLAEGSEEAGWALLDRYSSNILRAARRHLPADLRRTVDSTDIVQSVWKSLLRKGPQLETLRSPDQLIAYLAGMARRKVLESQRAHSRRQPDRFPAAAEAAGPRARFNQPFIYAVDQCRDTRGQTPSTIAEFREAWSRALEQTGDRGQRIVQLRLKGLTLDEIAGEMNLGKRTVQRTLAALLASLEA